MQPEAPVFCKVSTTARDAGGAQGAQALQLEELPCSLACHLLCMCAACKEGSFSLIFSHL